MSDPLTIYEVHLPSWRRVPEEGGRPLTHREAGPRLGAYARSMNFTHVAVTGIPARPAVGREADDLAAMFDALRGEGVEPLPEWPRGAPPADLGWTRDALAFLEADPSRRPERYRSLVAAHGPRPTPGARLLALPAEEMTAPSGSLLARMPGDDWQKRAALRTLFAWRLGQPGAKHVFMGGEFGQWEPWRSDRSLDWHLLEDARHAGLKRWVEDVNRVHRAEPALHERDADLGGFEWVEAHDADRCVAAFLRHGRDPADLVLGVINFLPVPRENYRVGVPRGGPWREILNGDATLYGGSGRGNLGGVDAVPVPAQGRPASVVLTLPPMAGVFLKSGRRG